MCRCLKLIAALCILSACCMHSVNGIRSKRTSNEDQTVESVPVDIKDEKVLRMFNLTTEELKKITQGVATNKAGATAPPKDSQRFTNIKDFRVGDIRNKIEMAVNAHGMISSENAEASQRTQHEMAAYPLCNSETNESSWQNDSNVTIRFSHSLFEFKSKLFLESAILRLYKLNPNHTVEPTEPTKRCSDPNIDSQIRVTVSILVRKNRQRKKHTCSTLMMNISQIGWVEIDIKHAIHIWESVNRQHGSSVLVGWLMIEVHDEEERPLKPGLFFRPPKCDQADYAIPWNFYRSYAALSSSFTEQVPRIPRIDIELTGIASLLPHNPRARPNFSLTRDIYRLSHPNSEESTTSITPTDNLLDPSAPTEIHRHRQRHARHHRHHSHNSASSIDGIIVDATVATGSSTKSESLIEDTNEQVLDC